MAKISSKGRSLSKNEKIIIGVLGILGVIALCFVIIIQPGENKMKNLKNEINSLEQEIESAEMIEMQIKDKTEKLNKLALEFEEASNALPKTDKYPQLSKDLKSMADASNVRIASVRYDAAQLVPEDNQNNQNKEENKEEPENKPNTVGLYYLKVGIDVEGKMPQVMDFINKIESSDRMLLTSNASIIGDDSDKKSKIEILYYISSNALDEFEEYDFN